MFDFKKKNFFLKNFIVLIKNFFSLLITNKYYYVFYSEKHNYQGYYISLINELSKRNKSILYLSSDINDYIKNNDAVTNLYVGKKFLRYFAFVIVNAKYFFLTTTDLNKNELKKNKNVNKYVYIFHCVNSITNVYTKTAFDEYDIICCIGDYHLHEFNQPKYKDKILLKTGYFYYDYINAKKNDIKSEKKISDTVLVAPSWNYSPKNFLELHCLNLIHILLKQKYKVIFRPHQEHFKRNKKTISKIYDEFYQNNNFEFDTNPFNLNSLFSSSYLITDYSGIAHEFIFLINKPVLYFKNLSKIHNTDQDRLTGSTIEEYIFEKFGFPIYEKDINDIDSSINNSKENFNKKFDLINKFAEENFYNFKESDKASIYFFE